MAQAHTLPRNEQGIAEAVARLRNRFGDRCHIGQAIRDQHAHTTTYIRPQPPDAVVFPMCTQDVSDIVKTCAAHKVPVIPFGTGTSLEGHVNAPAGGVCVDLSQMNTIVAVHAEDLDCVVQPGVTREDLNTHLRDQGLFFPIDPGANASLGGMAATRASGTNAVRYGTMKDNVISVEAVMPDGRIIRTAQRAKKTSAGYDLTRLLVGSEGTLGFITELTLRLYGIPEAISAARISFASVDAACRAVMTTIQYGIPVARIELMDVLSVKAANAYADLGLPEAPLLLLEFHGTNQSVCEQADTFASIAEEFGGSGFATTTTPEQRSKLWKARHNAYWSALQLRPGAKGISTDVCVPISNLATAVEGARKKAKELELLAPMVGHVGDGNFHTLILIDPEAHQEIDRAEAFMAFLAEEAIRLDGTCTGEHGIGQGKIPFLAQELGTATDYMAAVKAAFDPLGIMNPGKIIPPSR